MADMTFRRGEYTEYAGVSTEAKPTRGISSGSIFTEVDTGKVFFFNRATLGWVYQFSFQTTETTEE